MFGCKHKYGKVEDGYQYCEKCGKAITAPLRQCNHKWVELTQYTVSNIVGHNVTGNIYIMRCEHCGEMDKVVVSA